MYVYTLYVHMYTCIIQAQAKERKSNSEKRIVLSFGVLSFHLSGLLTYGKLP